VEALSDNSDTQEEADEETGQCQRDDRIDQRTHARTYGGAYRVDREQERARAGNIPTGNWGTAVRHDVGNRCSRWHGVRGALRVPAGQQGRRPGTHRENTSPTAALEVVGKLER
jgi:hypothetical protein